jgi:hypothetical protein
VKFSGFFSCHEIISLHPSFAMKLHKLIIATAVTATAFAGESTATAAAPAGNDHNAYVAVSGLYNEFSQGVEAQGFRVDAGFGLGNNLSLDARFENAYTDEVAGTGPGSQELKFNELRALAHYTQQVNDNVSLIGGLGYGKLGFSYGGMDFLSTEGLLADVGVKVQSGRVSAALTYTHLFAFHTASFVGGGVEDKDIGLLEGSLGYQLTDNVSAIASAQTQVLGNTEIEKDLSLTLGLSYSF